MFELYEIYYRIMIAVKHYTNYIHKACACYLQFYDLYRVYRIFHWNVPLTLPISMAIKKTHVLNWIRKEHLFSWMTAFLCTFLLDQGFKIWHVLNLAHIVYWHKKYTLHSCEYVDNYGQSFNLFNFNFIICH